MNLGVIDFHVGKLLIHLKFLNDLGFGQLSNLNQLLYSQMMFGGNHRELLNISTNLAKDIIVSHFLS